MTEPPRIKLVTAVLLAAGVTVFVGRPLVVEGAAVASAAQPPCSFPRSAPKPGQSFKQVLRNGSYPDASTEFGRTWLWDHRYGAESSQCTVLEARFDSHGRVTKVLMRGGKPVLPRWQRKSPPAGIPVDPDAAKADIRITLRTSTETNRKLFGRANFTALGERRTRVVIRTSTTRFNWETFISSRQRTIRLEPIWERRSSTVIAASLESLTAVPHDLCVHHGTHPSLECAGSARISD